jgi:hypothetical protein
MIMAWVIVYVNSHGRELRRICYTEIEANEKAAQLKNDGFRILSIGPITYRLR